MSRPVRGVAKPPRTAQPQASRRIACQSCRQRKKKCDGKYPQCSNCIRLGHQCFYAPIQTTTADNLQPWTFAAPPTQSIFTPGWEGSSGLGHELVDQPSASVREFSSLVNTELARRNQQYPPNPSAYETFGDDAELYTVDSPTGPSTFQGGVQLPVVADDLAQSAQQQSTPGISTGSASNIEAHGAQASDTGSTSELRFPTEHIPALIEHFFGFYHDYLPSLHRQRLTDKFLNNEFDLENDPLPWAIAAIAGRCALHGIMREQTPGWLAHAKLLLDRSIATLTHSQHAVQAGLWIAFHHFIRASLPELWATLGQTCRLASLVGFDREDDPYSMPSPFVVVSQDPLDVEERRQTIWALYILDRVMSCLHGWPLAIDDRLFAVNFPVDDVKFQAGDLSGIVEQFTTDLWSLFSSLTTSDISQTRPLRLIQKCCVVLGRILIHSNHRHSSVNPDEHKAEFETLQKTLARFKVTCQTEVPDVFCVKDEDIVRFIWLQILMQMCTMLLYHPLVTPQEQSPVATASEPSSGMGGAGEPASPTTTRSTNTNTSASSATTSHGFKRCLSAMQQIIMLVKETSNRTIKPLTNPFLLPAYFLCCRFLAITWHEKRDTACKENIDFMLLLIDRASRIWGPLAARLKSRILEDLQRDPEWARRMRVGGGSYLSGDSLLS